MVSNLLRLAEITCRLDLRRSAERAMDAFAATLKAAPSSVPQLLVALPRAGAHSQQVVIAGDRQAPEHRRWSPPSGGVTCRRLFF